MKKYKSVTLSGGGCVLVCVDSLILLFAILSLFKEYKI
jgi:hypothetical protein